MAFHLPGEEILIQPQQRKPERDKIHCSSGEMPGSAIRYVLSQRAEQPFHLVRLALAWHN